MGSWHSVVWLFFVLYSAAIAQGPAAAQPSILAGQWVLYLVPARVVLTQDGNTITGNLNELKLAGTMHGNTADLTATRPDGKTFGSIEIKVTGAELTGLLRRGSVETPLKMHRIGGQGTFPQIHTFVPTPYSRVFSSTLPPSLHINPGDTVKTTTVDAGGYDEEGISRSLGGNPQAGPFYVEGSLPGDTLAITIKRIRLNRDSAASGGSIVPVALTPDYYRNSKLDDAISGNWKLDLEHGTASLANPTPRLKDFKIELKPMLGCVAVAPRNNATFRTGWLGSLGWKYRLPRYPGRNDHLSARRPGGALLYLGDAHALQATGELNGDALETSAEVEFTVNVIPNVSTSGPRAENNEYLISIGIAGSLDAALKQATTQLAEWIENNYKLTPNEAAIVLGTTVRYEIAEVVDPQVNVVAKVSKRVLAQILK